MAKEHKTIRLNKDHISKDNNIVLDNYLLGRYNVVLGNGRIYKFKNKKHLEDVISETMGNSDYLLSEFAQLKSKLNAVINPDNVAARLYYIRVIEKDNNVLEVRADVVIPNDKIGLFSKPTEPLFGMRAMSKLDIKDNITIYDTVKIITWDIVIKRHEEKGLLKVETVLTPFLKMKLDCSGLTLNMVNIAEGYGKSKYLILSLHPSYSTTWTLALYWTSPKYWKFKTIGDFLKNVWKLGFSLKTQDACIKKEYQPKYSVIELKETQWQTLHK